MADDTATKTIDDIVTQLEKLNNVAEMSKSIADATFALLSGTKYSESTPPGGGDVPSDAGTSPDKIESAGAFSSLSRLVLITEHIATLVSEGIRLSLIYGGGSGGGYGSSGDHLYSWAPRPGESDIEKEARENRIRSTPLTRFGRFVRKTKDYVNWAGATIKKGEIIGRGVGESIAKISNKFTKASRAAKAKRIGDLGAAKASRAATPGEAAKIAHEAGSSAAAIKSGAAAEASLGAAGGVAGAAVAGVIALGVAAYQANKAVSQWTEEAMASAAKLAEVSGSMAAVMAEREVRQVQRDIQMGEATSGSAFKLMEAESRRKDATAPIEAALSNLQNNLLSTANELLTPIIEAGNNILELVKTIPGIGSLLGDKEDKKGLWGINKEMTDTMAVIKDIEADNKKRMEEARQSGMAAMGSITPNGIPTPYKL